MPSLLANGGPNPSLRLHTTIRFVLRLRNILSLAPPTLSTATPAPDAAGLPARAWPCAPLTREVRVRRTINSACPTTTKAVISANAISKPPARALAASFPVAMLLSSQPVELATLSLDGHHFALISSDLP